jgi:hypothetical protein
LEAAALFDLSDDIFFSLPDFDSSADFDEAFAKSLNELEEFRHHMMVDDSGIKWMDAVNSKEISNPVAFLDYEQLIDLAWEFASREDDRSIDLLKDVVLFASLYELEMGIFALQEKKSALREVMRASLLYGRAEGLHTSKDGIEHVKTLMAARAAKARHAKDPKQNAKRLVRECWDEWIANPGRYSKQSDFALDVIEKVPTNAQGAPIISFDTIIKRWIPAWKREKK